MLANYLRLILGLALLTCLLLAAWLHFSLSWSAAPAVVAGLIAAPAVHAALLGVEFVVTWWLGRNVVLPADARRLHLGGRVKACLTEIPTAIRAFGLRMPWAGDRPLPSASKPTQIPVVLIHGYFCNRAMFKPLAAYLAARGHPVEAVNLEPVFGSIDQYPALIDIAVQAARDHSADGQVALIGHSMGGIAARAYLRDFGDKGIERVITLGSPHHGTKLAHIGHTEIVRQLQPGNPWLSALAQAEPPDRYRRFTVVLSEHDNIVTPQCSQTLPGAATVCISGLGHVDLACHPAVFSLISTALESHHFQPEVAGLRTTAETT